MNPQDYENLAPLYALGALDGEDLARFTEELGRSESLRALVREYQEASTALPMSLPPAPSSTALKSRVLGAATGGQSAPKPAILTRVFWAAAAVILIAIVIGTLSDFKRHTMKPGKGYEDATGYVLWKDNEVKLRARGLAALPHGKVYELWRIPAGGAPEPAGAYSVDESGRVYGEFSLTSPVTATDVFAVTIEPGLQKAPTGPMPLTPGK